MWMVARVHHRATHRWTTAHVARAPGLTDGAVLVIDIAYLSDSRHAQDMYPALLARWQAKLGIITLFRHQLRAHTRAAHQLAAAPARQFHVVNGGTGRDILQGQSIANLDVGLWPRHHPIAHFQTERGDNIALHAIQVMQERDAR